MKTRHRGRHSILTTVRRRFGDSTSRTKARFGHSGVVSHDQIKFSGSLSTAVRSSRGRPSISTKDRTSSSGRQHHAPISKSGKHIILSSQRRQVSRIIDRSASNPHSCETPGLRKNERHFLNSDEVKSSRSFDDRIVVKRPRGRPRKHISSRENQLNAISSDAIENSKEPNKYLNIQPHATRVQSHLSPEPPFKRKRGRPPSVRCAATPIQSDLEAEVDRSSKHDGLASISNTECLLNNSAEFSRAYVEKNTVSALPLRDLLYGSSGLRFGSTDDVLQGILREVNANGCVPRSLKPSIPSEQGIGYDSQTITTATKFVFSEPVISSVFEDMWANPGKVLHLESKDLFLALNGLLRPGVCELWRRRREEQTKQLTRSIMGRLRPNPRPRRYSDMIVVNNGTQADSKHLSRFGTPDASFGEKFRTSSRSLALAAARLTAAKKLIRARSQPYELKRTCGATQKGSRYTGLLRGKKRHTSRQSPTSRRALVRTTRSCRRPDVSHHIDWKFCYSSITKESGSTSSLTDQLPRRRQKYASPDSRTVSETASIESQSQPNSEDGIVLKDSGKGFSLCNAEQLASSSSVDRISQRSPAKMSSPMKSEPRSFLSQEWQPRGRRKRHALTVQRKLPVDRFMQTAKTKLRQGWGIDTAFLSHLDEESSLSSAGSVSGSTDRYGRNVISRRWPRSVSKGMNERSSSPSRSHSPTLLSSRISKRTHSPSHAKQNLMRRRSSTLSRRTSASPRLSSRQRLPRRPDRMCQLTLLDRLVLGLNCSVSQCDDEVHIKQLHAEELNILTQRMNKTGFFIQSLALKTNANNDQEYNLVLTFSPTSEGLARRVRCPSRGGFHDIDVSHRRTPSPDRKAISKSRATPIQERPSHSRNIRNRICNSKPLATVGSLEQGYLSDSAVLSVTRNSMSRVREVHSDSEVVESKHMYKATLSKFGHLFSQSRNVGRGTSHRTRLHLNAPHSIYSRDPVERLGLTPSNELDRRSVPIFKSHQEDSEGSNIPISPLVSHGMSKRPLRLSASAIQTITAFKRHSPRKVIRKVYTGSMTIPKILNRKRPNVTAPAPVSSSSVVPSVLSSASIASTNTAITSAIMYTPPQSISTLPSMSTGTTPASLFDAPSIMPVYHHASLPLPYRPFSSSRTSIPGIPTASIQFPSSVTPIPSTSSAIADGRPASTLRVQNAPLLPASSLSPFVSISSEYSDAQLSESLSGAATNHVNTIVTTPNQPTPPDDSKSTTETTSGSVKPPTATADSPKKAKDEADIFDEGELDDSNTPATSLCASQLLRRKRVQDDGQTAISDHSEADTGSPRPSLSSSRVTQPEFSGSRQSTESDHRFCSSTSNFSAPFTGSNSLPPSLNLNMNSTGRDKLNLICEEDHMNFELKTVDSISVTNPSFGPLKIDLFSRPTCPPQHSRLSPSLSSSLRFSKPTWPPTYPASKAAAPTAPIFSQNLTAMHGLAAPKHPVSFDAFAPNQVATRVVVQNPASLSRSDSYDSPELNTFTPVAFGDSQPPTGDSTTSIPHPVPLLSGPGKRTVVHKYHSFRKILPKSPEHSGSFATGPFNPPSTMMNLASFSPSSPRLTQLPMVHSGVFRSGVLPMRETAPYFVDITSDFSYGDHSNRPLDIEVPPNPASQLLKSLLEKTDAGESSASSSTLSASASSGLSSTPFHVTTCTPGVLSQPPPHQSRGTWQLGKRATAAHRPSADVTTPTQSGTDVPSVREPRRTSASALPSSIRLVRGSTSRLQQVGQHYQRRQQMQQQRQASQQQQQLQQHDQATGDEKSGASEPPN